MFPAFSAWKRGSPFLLCIQRQYICCNEGEDGLKEEGVDPAGAA